MGSSRRWIDQVFGRNRTEQPAGAKDIFKRRLESASAENQERQERQQQAQTERALRYWQEAREDKSEDHNPKEGA